MSIHINMRHLLCIYLRCCFIIILVLIGHQTITARTLYFPYRDTTFLTGRVGDAHLITDLNGPWESDMNRTFDVPFCSDDYFRLELRREFFLAEMPQDTMMLYFEGLMWTAEIYVNDRLIFISKHPFQGYTLALPPKILNAQWNKLKIILTNKGTNIPDAPIRMIGIHKPVYLFGRKSVHSVPSEMRFPLLKDTPYTLVYIPFSEKFGYNIEPRKAYHDFQQIKAAGVTAIYFPYKPSLHLLDLMQRAGLNLQLQKTEQVAYFRRIKYRFTTLGEEHIAWLDEDGNKTPHFGRFEKVSHQAKPIDWSKDKMNIIIMVMIPLLMIVFWKLVNDRTFRLMLYFGNLNFNHNEIIRGATTVSISVIYYNVLLRITMTAAIITMLIWILKVQGLLNTLDLIREPSWLRLGVQMMQDRLLVLYGFIVAFLLIWQIFRSLLLNVLSSIYNRTELNLRILIIENCSDLPYLIFLTFLWFVLMLSPTTYYTTWMVIGLVLGLAFLMRKYWTTFIMLDNVLRMPIFINFVYICTLDWLPWILLL